MEDIRQNPTESAIKGFCPSISDDGVAIITEIMKEKDSFNRTQSDVESLLKDKYPKQPFGGVEDDDIAIHTLRNKIVLLNKADDHIVGYWEINPSNDIYRNHPRDGYLLPTKKHCDTLIFVDCPVALFCLRRWNKSEDTGFTTIPRGDELDVYEWDKIAPFCSIYIVQKENPDNFEQSFYPFYNELKQHSPSAYLYEYSCDLKGRALHEAFGNVRDKWEGFQKTVKEHSNDHIPEPEEDAFKIEANAELFYPQDFIDGVLYYGFRGPSKKIIMSRPIDVMTDSELLDTMDIKVPGGTHDVEFDDRLHQKVLQKGCVAPEKCFRDLRIMLKHHIYLSNEAYYTIISLWIMGTYLYRVFDSYPYLQFIGSKDTGKSSFMELISIMGFNGKLMSETTTASLKEICDQRGGVLGIDEFEKGTPKDKKEYVTALNSGYNKKGQASKQSGNTTRTMQLYCPKMVGSIDEMANEALESRMFRIEMVKVNPSTNDIEDFSLASRSTRSWVDSLKVSLYTFALHHAEDIFTSYKSIQSITIKGKKITGRELELLRPLLAISSVLDGVNAKSGIEEYFSTLYTDKTDVQEERAKWFRRVLAGIGQSSIGYRVKDNLLYLVTKSIGDYGGVFRDQYEFKDWLLSFDRGVVTSDSIHINSDEGSKGCVGIPLELVFDGKTKVGDVLAVT